jgi:hypothetical protein
MRLECCFACAYCCQHALHAQVSLCLPPLFHLWVLLSLNFLFDFLLLLFQHLFLLFVDYLLPVHCGFILLWKALHLELITP